MTATKLKLIAIIALSAFLASGFAHAASSTSVLNGATPLDQGALNSYAGGSGLVNISSATVNSTISNNSIGNVGFTGEISDNVMSNNSGLSSMISNTGNQVSISQSTIVNVFLH
jgi:hypothetical protein